MSRYILARFGFQVHLLVSTLDQFFHLIKSLTSSNYFYFLGRIRLTLANEFIFKLRYHMFGCFARHQFCFYFVSFAHSIDHIHFDYFQLCFRIY